MQLTKINILVFQLFLLLQLSLLLILYFIAVKGAEATCVEIPTENEKMFQTERRGQFQCSLTFFAHINMF